MGCVVLKHECKYYSIEKDSYSELSPTDDNYPIDDKDAFVSNESQLDLEQTVAIVRSIITLSEQARNAYSQKQFQEASASYERIAELCASLGDKANSQDYYAYAAIMMEHSEKWRHISELWYKASGSVSQVSDYKDYNSLQHSYPTISVEKWNSFNRSEKKARAIQYAAFSEDNYNGPSDSYWLYEQAIDAYEQAKNYGRMIECMISATNRYATQYSSLPQHLFDKWNRIIHQKEITRQYREMIILSFEEIYKLMNRHETNKAKFFYINSKKLSIAEFWNKRQYLKSIQMTLWMLSTNFNTSLIRIILSVVMPVLVVFPILFIYTGENISYISAVRMSLSNFLGIAAITSDSWGIYLVGVVEVIYAYFALVVIGSYVISRTVKDLR